MPAGVLHLAVTFLLSHALPDPAHGAPCRSPFSDTNGVCIHVTSEKKPYCEAQELCKSYGGELIYGDNFHKARPLLPSGELWIGLTDMLEERGRNQELWQWTDGTTANVSVLADGAEAEDCARLRNHEIWDIHCDKEFVAVCQQMSEPPTILSARFEVKSMLQSTDTRDYAYAPCLQNLTGIISRLMCAARCLATESKPCASFYFNRKKQECVLVLHTDASVNLVPADEWTKFVMTAD